MSGVVLLELMAEGLVGIEALARVPMVPGINHWPEDDKHLTAMEALQSLLLHTGDVAQRTAPGATQARAALTLRARNGQQYRLLYDVTKQARALQRQQGNAYVVVTSDAREVQQALTAELGLPPTPAWRALFHIATSTAASAQSALPNEEAPAAAKPAAKSQRHVPGFDDAEPSMPAARPDFSADDDDDVPTHLRGLSIRQLQQRLDAMDAAAGARARLEQLGFEVEGAQRRIEQLERELKPYFAAQQEQRALVEEAGSFAALLTLPEDFLMRVQRYEETNANHAALQARLQTQQEKVMIQAARMSTEVSGLRQRPAFQDDADAGAGDVRVQEAKPLVAAAQLPTVRYGVLVGVLAMGIGAVGFFSAPMLRYVAFLNIPAFGVALFGALQLLRELEHGASLRLKVARLHRERKQSNDALLAVRTDTARALQRGGFSMEQLDEVVQLAMRRDQVAAARVAVEKRLDEYASPAFQRLLDEHARKVAEVTELQRELQAGGADAAGALDADREKAAIEKRLARLREPTANPATLQKAATPAPVARVPTPPPTAVVARYPDVAVDVVRALQDVLFVGADDICKQLHPRAQQVLGALSSNQWTDIELTPQHSTAVRADGSRSRTGELSANDRDVIQLALRMAAAELAARAGRGMFMVDASCLQQVTTAPMAQRALQFLEQHAQVVVFGNR
jgi:hypothetical protein